MSGNELNLARLDLARVEAALTHKPIGHTVEYHASVPSTMALARRLAKNSAVRPGAIAVAEEQTAGRGRLTRRWDAPYGQALLLTVVLKPPLLPPKPAHLPMLAGVAIAEAMTDVEPALAGGISLKWPNDILLVNPGNRPFPVAVSGKDARPLSRDSRPSEPSSEPVSMRKVAGILIEAAFSGPAIEYALLGMGINVNQDSTMLPPAAKGGLVATSMREYLGHDIDRTALAIALCRRLTQQLAASGHDGGEGLYQTWSRRLITIGSRVTVHLVESDSAVKGIAVNVDRNGNLAVVDDGGKRHTFGAGDVSLHPPLEASTQETESFDVTQSE